MVNEHNILSMDRLMCEYEEEEDTTTLYSPISFTSEEVTPAARRGSPVEPAEKPLALAKRIWKYDWSWWKQVWQVLWSRVKGLWEFWLFSRQEERGRSRTRTR